MGELQLLNNVIFLVIFLLIDVIIGVIFLVEEIRESRKIHENKTENGEILCK